MDTVLPLFAKGICDELRHVTFYIISKHEFLCKT